MGTIAVARPRRPGQHKPGICQIAISGCVQTTGVGAATAAGRHTEQVGTSMAPCMCRAPPVGEGDACHSAAFSQTGRTPVFQALHWVLTNDPGQHRALMASGCCTQQPATSAPQNHCQHESHPAIPIRTRAQHRITPQYRVLQALGRTLLVRHWRPQAVNCAKKCSIFKPPRKNSHHLDHLTRKTLQTKTLHDHISLEPSTQCQIREPPSAPSP